MSEEIKLEDAQVESLLNLKKQDKIPSFKSENEHHKLFKSYFQKRDEELKSIKEFWPIVFRNHHFMGISTAAPGDSDVLKSLEGVSVERNDNDYREFTITLTFGDNEFFSNKTLSKSYKVVKQGETATDEEIINYDPERDLTSTACEINWKSDDKNLVKKNPRTLDPNDDDPDAPGDPGSFFNFLTTEKDVLEIGQILADEVYPSAIEIFLGLEDDNLDDEDEFEEDDDPEAEIDLEEPELKRSRKD